MKTTDNCKTASYDIFSTQAPGLPKGNKGAEFLKFIGSQSTKSMRPVLLPMALTAMSTYANGITFVYCDNKSYELCGEMCHLIASSGVGKGQWTSLCNVIMRGFVEHDKGEYERLAEWQRQTKRKGANSQKPERPDIAIWFPPADMTNPAFIQNAMAMEKCGNRTQYLNLSEVEYANKLCGGHRQVSMMVRNIYDVQRAGALRVSADGVSGNPVLRVNMTFSSTPEAARDFYRRDMTNGFFGRIPFAFKAREARVGRVPRQGEFSEGFVNTLQGYINILSNAEGSNIVVKPLNKVIDELAAEMATVADLADDDMLFELSHRSIFAAWKKGCVLWLLNNRVWTKNIGDYVKWFAYSDLWGKVQVFGDMLHTSISERKGGPKNMLDDLPEAFTMQQLEALRESLEKNPAGARHQTEVWKNRGFVVFDADKQLFCKTKEYLKGKKKSNC